MSDWGSWVFWTVGGLLSLSGLLLILFGVIGDRSRGRRRCPKCWYDMRATNGLLCTECGHTAKSERRLHRTRRRYKAVLGGLFVIASAGIAAAYPMIRSGGWVGHSPTTILILRIPAIDSQKHPVLTELHRRLVPGYQGFFDSRGDRQNLWEWQRDVLVRQCALTLETRPSPIAEELALELMARFGQNAEPALPALIDYLSGGPPRSQSQVCSVIEKLGPRAKLAVPALIKVAQSSAEEWSGASAIKALGAIGPDAAEAVPILNGIVAGEKRARSQGDDQSSWMRRLLDTDAHRKQAAVEALGKIGPAARTTISALAGCAKEDNYDLHVAAIRSIAQIGPEGEDAISALLKAHRSSDVGLREAAAVGIRAVPDLKKRAIEEMLQDLESSDAEARLVAVRRLMSLDADAVGALPGLRNALKDARPTVRLFAARTLRMIGAAVGDARADLELATEDEDPLIRHEAALALRMDQERKQSSTERKAQMP